MKFLLALLSAICLFQMASAAAISRRAPGFVQTDGTYFSLDGYKYTVVGYVDCAPPTFSVANAAL
jgi:hypothetical protein